MAQTEAYMELCVKIYATKLPLNLHRLYDGFSSIESGKHKVQDQISH